MKKKLFLMIVLLCAVVQGAWAQSSWDEVYELTHAGVYINNGVVKVNK